jgi:hypothetical protein
MMGYMANPALGDEHVAAINKKNAEAIDADGWLHSGDKASQTRPTTSFPFSSLLWLAPCRFALLSVHHGTRAAATLAFPRVFARGSHHQMLTILRRMMLIVRRVGRFRRPLTSAA